MKALLVEDDPNKAATLRQFLSERLGALEFEEARSFQSAKRLLLSVVYDVVLLDMQLTQFDRSLVEEGGRRRALAGFELLRQMQRHGVSTPAIVITQFKEFGDETESLDLDGLISRVRTQRFPNYRGTIYYDPKITDWQRELSNLLAPIVQRGTKK